MKTDRKLSKNVEHKKCDLDSYLVDVLDDFLEVVIGDTVVDRPLELLDSADMFLNLVEVVLPLQSVDGTSHLFQVADMLQNLVEVVRVVRDVVERAL